jgi:RNA polymerase sigma-70 factor (ECF subfamily)
MGEAAQWDLERYRPLLRLQVRRMQLGGAFLRRRDESDLVQNAFVKALENLDLCQAKTEAELVKWLQTILKNEVFDNRRRDKTQKENIALERSLEAALADSSARLAVILPDPHSSPSEQAERKELLLRIAAGVDQLPEDQRDAILQRYTLGASVCAIAKQMGRSEKAVAGLLARALAKLRELQQKDL